MARTAERAWLMTGARLPKEISSAVTGSAPRAFAGRSELSDSGSSGEGPWAMAEIAQDEANAKTASDEQKLLSAGSMIFSWPGLPFHHIPIAKWIEKVWATNGNRERANRHPVDE